MCLMAGKMEDVVAQRIYQQDKLRKLLLKEFLHQLCAGSEQLSHLSTALALIIYVTLSISRHQVQINIVFMGVACSLKALFVLEAPTRTKNLIIQHLADLPERNGLLCTWGNLFMDFPATGFLAVRWTRMRNKCRPR